MAKVMWVIQGDGQLKGALLHPFVRFKMGFLRDFEGGRFNEIIGQFGWERTLGHVASVYVCVPRQII